LRCEWGRRVGWVQHQGFGLRQEWVNLVLQSLSDWRETGGLGPRQVDALEAWLRTAGLADNRRWPTALFRLFQDTWPEAKLAWQLLWVEVVFRFPTAAWYVHELERGEWTTTELAELLHKSVPRLASRTTYNSILELVGPFERTTVGTALGQGQVSPERPRRICRDGFAFPPDAALLHALRLLFLRETQLALRLEQDLLWPWTVFGTTLGNVWPQLVVCERPWLDVENQTLNSRIPLEELAHVALF